MRTTKSSLSPPEGEVAVRWNGLLSYVSNRSMKQAQRHQGEYNTWTCHPLSPDHLQYQQLQFHHNRTSISPTKASCAHLENLTHTIMPSNQMSKSDSSRIQSSQVRPFPYSTSNIPLKLFQATGGKNMTSGGFAARAQSAGDRNANSASSSSGKGSGYGSVGSGGDKGGGSHGSNGSSMTGSGK